MKSINKNVLLIIGVIFLSLAVAGGTYAFLTLGLNPTNNSYNTITGCFNVDYTIDNVDNTQEIRGTMFPSGTLSDGLNGRVGFKAKSTCNINGIGTLKLHINSTTSTKLTTSAASYCESRKTLEKIDGITTEEDCKADNVNGRWRGYGDSYCESNTTLERLTAYTDSSSCSANGGTWKSGGSPLKYAVYDNSNATGNPLSKGYITNSNIGGDVTLLEDIPIGSTQKYYYIYIWLDGYLIDSTYTELPFDGYIKAEAMQLSSNLLYGLNDVSNGTFAGRSYSINNGIVTLTANTNDSCLNTYSKVYLEAGKTYIFNCDTDATWLPSTTADTVDGYLLLASAMTGGCSSAFSVQLRSNSNFSFTAPVTGLYYLRLDVNQTGKTYTFSNIKIEEVK